MLKTKLIDKVGFEFISKKGIRLRYANLDVLLEIDYSKTLE